MNPPNRTSDVAPLFEPLEPRVLLSSDLAGNSLADALDLGVLDETQTVHDFVGTTDTEDYYRFEIASPVRDFTARLDGLSEGAKLEFIEDVNDNGELDPGDVLGSDTGSQYGPARIARWLDPGVWYVRVSQWHDSDNTTYDLTLSEKPQPTSLGRGDNRPGTARDLGVLGGTQTVHDFVGTTDTEDYYRFEIASPVRDFTARLDGLSDGAELEFIEDVNDNGELDPGDVLGSDTGSQYGPARIARWLDPGVWYVRVSQWHDSDNTTYDLTLSEKPQPTSLGRGDNRPGTARDLGVLGGTQTVHDFVGTTDTEDYYRFEIASPVRDFTARLDGLSDGAELEFIEDVNDNGELDPGDVLGSDTGSQYGPARIARWLDPGVWYVRVSQWHSSDNTTYDLTLSGTPEITWVPDVPVGNYTPASRTAADIRWIVLHTTEGTASSAINWFKDPASGVSAHYLVRRDGSILQFVGDDDIAHHAGNWRYNQHSIGIEHERYTGAELTDVQLAASAQLVQWLADQYDIPVVFPQGVAPPDPVSGGGFIGHDQVPDPSDPSQGGGANRHSDPANWDWGYYRSLFYGSLPAAPSDLTAVALTGEEIQVEWEDCSEGEQGFRVERRTGLDGDWTEVGTEGADSTAFHDTGLASDTTYYYRTCAYNAQGSSGYSNVAQATPREALAPRIEYVEPAAPTVSDEPQPFTVHGSNFAAGAAMTLTCLSTGEVSSDVPITSHSNSHLTADVDFGNSPGRWNVEVVNPGDIHSAKHHFDVSRVVEGLLGWGFDYPIGNRGYDEANHPVPLEEFPAAGDDTPEVNGLYPHNPVADPSRGSSGAVAAGTWYNVQDVGSFFGACGGIHSGEDWNRAPAPNGDVGQNVYAVGSGTVIRASDGGSNGWTLVVRHEIPGSEPVYSIYEHVEPLPKVEPVANGIAVEVTRGEQIATVAPITAYSPHLHFEIRTRYTVDGLGGNIRDVPGGTDIGDVPAGPEQTGTLRDGPVRAEYMGNEYTWWKVDWGEGLVGWSVEAALNFLLYDTANSSYYYSNSERKPLSSMDAGQVAEAFYIMQEEGIEDASDYIDANRYTLAHYLRNGLFAFASMGAWGTGGSGLVEVVETSLAGLRRHWANLTAQSPVTLSQTVSTPESEFQISFDYQFQTTTGTLEIVLDSVVVDTIEAPASLSDEVSSHTSTVWSPTLAGRENAALQFRLDGPEGSQMLLTNVRLEPSPESGLAATWTGGADDRWENASNWSRPTPPGSWSESSFDQPTAHSPVLSQDQSVGRVRFLSADWTIGGTGHTLTLGDGGIDSAGIGTNTVDPDVVLAEDSTWTVSASNTLILNGTLSGGDHTLTKDGDGTLMVGGAHGLMGLNLEAGAMRLVPGGSGVDVTGTLTLGDDTALEFVFGGADPFQAGTYTLASYGALAGTFSGGVTDLGAYTTGTGVAYGANEITITLDASLLPGDATLDRTVNLNDFARLRNNFGTGDTWAEADFNGDYTVNLNDFAILRNNFGSSAPEPATLAILAMGGGMAVGGPEALPLAAAEPAALTDSPEAALLAEAAEEPAHAAETEAPAGRAPFQHDDDFQTALGIRPRYGPRPEPLYGQGSVWTVWADGVRLKGAQHAGLPSGSDAPKQSATDIDLAAGSSLLDPLALPALNVRL